MVLDALIFPIAPFGVLVFGLFNKDFIGLFGVAFCLISDDAGSFFENGGFEVYLSLFDFRNLIFFILVNTFVIGSFFR